MSESENALGRLRQMRGRAEDLERTVERAIDPVERRRLQDEAHRLEPQSAHVGGAVSGDICPTEQAWLPA